MLSFIVIGKNEGFKISLCIQSIMNTVNYNCISNYEIIYVDSNSIDDSISRVKEFPSVKIFKLTHKANAAIARNLGAKNAKGDKMLFIDGDMELLPEKLCSIYIEGNSQNYDFLSGDFVDLYYGVDGSVYKKKKYYNTNRNTYSNTVGGLFLISRHYWDQVGGMRIEFRRSQDLDFGLRMSNIGLRLMRVKDTIAIHHTVEYNHVRRVFKDILKGNWLYRGLLYKKNVMNRYMYREYFLSEITLIVYIIMIISFLSDFSSYMMILYMAFLFAKFIYKSYPPRQCLKRLLLFILADTNTLLSIILFWPRKPSNIQYIRVI